MKTMFGRSGAAPARSPQKMENKKTILRTLSALRKTAKRSFTIVRTRWQRPILRRKARGELALGEARGWFLELFQKCAQLPKCFVLNLTHTLSRNAKFCPHFIQAFGLRTIQAIACLKNARFPVR